MKKGLIVIFLLVVTGLVPSYLTSLEGKHLIFGSQISVGFSHVKLIRDVSGNVIRIEGIAVNALDALSKRFRFTYSSLKVNDSWIERQSDSLPGLAYYLAKGTCDLVIGPIVMTNKRLFAVDLAAGYAYTNIAIIIPMPESSDNSAAIAYPFQMPVWITLLLSMLITGVVIYFSVRPTTYRQSISDGMDRNILTPTQAIFEMVQVLLNQGGKFHTFKRKVVYFVVGSWCLAAFVLVCAYNSVLISYILGSNAQALVNSIEELAENPNVKLVIDKGFGVDIILSDAKVGIYKQLSDKLRTNPESRCVKNQDCVDLVKHQSYAHLQAIYTAIDIIDKDFKDTHICHLALAKNIVPMPGSLAWALAKNSPYTKAFTSGFMELHEAGLIDFWIRRELQKSRNAIYCMSVAKKKLERKSLSFDNQTRINLKNFTGAFYVLIVGYFISLVCFISENFIFRLKKALNV